MPNYTLLPKQVEFMQIPHDKDLDVAVYQGGFGSGKTFCGSLLGLLLARIQRWIHILNILMLWDMSKM
jgi:hypothetical protein